LEAYTGSAWQTPYGLTLVATATASAAASVTFDNVFTSTYDNYRIIFVQDATLANGTVQVKYRNGSGDVSTAKYAYQRIYAFGTTVGADSGADATTGYYGSLDGSGATGTERFLVVDVFNPFVSSASTGAICHNVTGQTSFNITQSNYNQAESFTGIKFNMQTGNITGNIKIYGYRNS
jgi:hypothetical protein